MLAPSDGASGIAAGPDLPDLWIGRALRRAGLVSDAQLKRTVAQEGGGGTLAERLVSGGLVGEERLYAALSQHLGITYADVGPDDMALEAVTLVPEKMCRQNHLVPIAEDVGTITVAVADPTDERALRLVRMVTGRRVKPVLVSGSKLRALLDHAFERPEGTGEAVDRIAALVPMSVVDGPKATWVDEPVHARAPLIRLVNLMIADAIKMRASDLHIEPREKVIAVRCRVDGILRTVVELPRRLLRPIVSRIKIMAGLDIADWLRPQDGKAIIRVGEGDQARKVELRVSSLPSALGEKVVMRILDQANAPVMLEQLGLSEPMLRQLQHSLSNPQGIILVTGPTGSGKTTTLYACLHAVRSEERNIVTVEDPVENQIPGITQVGVRPETGLTFAAALRSILRQDPDTILVGEIRDSETAGIAVQASMTGHLVLSTLHTNDAVSTILRLQDLGVEPFRVASSLTAILAQRLLRRPCPSCRIEGDPRAWPELVAWAERTGRDLADVLAYQTVGCEQCHGTGYVGRLAVVELLVASDPFRQVIHAGANEGELYQEALRDGMVPLRDDALAHVAAGDTTMDEVIRVLGAEGRTEGAQPSTQPAEAGAPHAELREPGTRAAAPQSLGEPEALAMEELMDLPTDPGRPPRILVADDEAQLRRMVARVLANHGFEVEEAADGQETISKVATFDPDLVLLDILMPKFDGFEVCHWLRSNIATLTLPVIIMTGLGTQEHQLRGFAVGADDYVVKPFDFDLLVARVVAVLRRAALRLQA